MWSDAYLNHSASFLVQYVPYGPESFQQVAHMVFLFSVHIFFKEGMGEEGKGEEALV